MCNADASLNKFRLGAKAILAVSLAVARAAAAAEQIPLYRYIDQLLDSRKQEFLTLPVPMLNVLNGGRHASNNLAFQEFKLYPTGAMSLAQGLRFAAEIFQQLKSLLSSASLDIKRFTTELSSRPSTNSGTRNPQLLALSNDRRKA
jgi:enolase